MLRVGICDDDSLFQKRISEITQNTLKKLNLDASIRIFADGNKIIADFKTGADYYDIVILDIEMPAINGKEVAQQLRALNPDFKLLFVTSFESEVYDVFQYNASAFVCKEQISTRLPEELTRILTEAQQAAQELAFFEVMDKNRKRNLRLPVSDIYYFECLNKKVYISTAVGEFQLLRKTYQEIFEYYQERNFVPIHRNCIVNIKYIFSINEIDIELDNHQFLPLSRRFKKNVVERFMATIKEELLL